MEFRYLKKNDSDNIDEKLSFRKNIELYLKYKKWFIISVSICLIVTFFKLYFTIPTYEVSASILIKDQNKGKSSADISTFEELGLFGSGGNVLENELEFLKSRRLMKKVVQELKLNIKYYEINSSRDSEIYQNLPVVVNLYLDSVGDLIFGGSFFIKSKNGDKFDMYDEEEEFIGTYRYGDKFVLNLENDDKSQNLDVSIFRNSEFFHNIIVISKQQ